MAASREVAEKLGFDPEQTICRNCWAEIDSPCRWGLVGEYHAERLEDGQFAAAVAAQIAGTAPDSKQWRADLKAAAEELV